MPEIAEHYAVAARKIVLRHKAIPADLREDIAQETAARLLALEANGKMDSSRLSASFIRTVAFNLFVSGYRKTKRLRFFREGEEHGAPCDTRRQRLNDLLEQAPLVLSPRQMDILRLRLRGDTIRQIAAELNMPAGTVGRLWADAMHLLQAALSA